MSSSIKTESAAAVVPPGLVTLTRSWAGAVVGLFRQCTRATHGGFGQLHGKLFGQALFDASRRQRLDQVKHIGGARAGDCGDGVHLVFTLQPDDLPDGGQKRLGQIHVRNAGMIIAANRRNPAPRWPQGCWAWHG